MTKFTRSILNRGSRMIQSHHILKDQGHQIYYGQMSEDDTIPLHSRRPRSPDHFRASAQGWCNPTATSLLPLSGKVIPKNTKLVLKVFVLYSRQRLHQHINNLFISTHILELYVSLMHHISNVEISDFYVLRSIVEHWGLCHLYTTLVIT